MNKANLVKKYIRKVSPHIKVDILNQRVPQNQDQIKEIIDEYKPDFIIETLPLSEEKYNLLKVCGSLEETPTISLGTLKGKQDPSKLQISLLRHCPHTFEVARIREFEDMRMVQKTAQIFYAYSSEMKADSQNNLEKDSDIYGSSVIAPSFGLAISSFVISTLGNEKIDTSIISDVRRNQYAKMFEKVKNVIIKNKTVVLGEDLDLETVYRISKIKWNFRCGKTNKRNSALLLGVWDCTKKMDEHNLVLLDQQYAQKLNKSKDNEDLQRIKIEIFTSEEIERIEGILSSKLFN